MYHATSWGIASAMVLCIYLIGNFGKTSYQTCFIAKNSRGQYIGLFPLLINFPLLLFLAVISLRIVTKDYEVLLFSLGLTNFLLSMTLVLSNLLNFIAEVNKHDIVPIELHIAAIIGACSGLVLSSARLCSKSLYIKIKKVLYRRTVSMQLVHISEDFRLDRSHLNYLNSTIWNLSEFFENITKKTVAEILITLHLRYNSLVEISQAKKFFIRYAKEKYLELENSQPHIENCNFYLVYSETCTIIEYCPDMFAIIKNKIGLVDSVLSNSLILHGNFYHIQASETNRGGKSDSFFYLTADEKFVLKTITPEEKEFFVKKMLAKYSLRVCNNESKIVRILGVFKVLPSNLYFVIMENIVPKRLSATIYDIKGYANSNRKGKNGVLKDMDFLEDFSQLGSCEKKEIIKNLQIDMNLLSDIGVMDYSILIGDYEENANVYNRYLVRVEPTPLVIGIIDIFQNFNSRKKIENKMRKFFSRNEFSCIDPQAYSNRMLNFLTEYL